MCFNKKMVNNKFQIIILIKYKNQSIIEKIYYLRSYRKMILLFLKYY